MAENFIKITYKRKEIYKTILLLFQHPQGGEFIFYLNIPQFCQTNMAGYQDA